MALRKPFVLSSEGFHEEIPVADALDVGAITINASGTGIDAGTKKITNVGDATADGDALVYLQSGAQLGNLTIASTGDITVSGGGELVGLPATPSGATAATSKAYVDQLAITGGPVKEAVLVSTQLDNTDGINAAAVITMANNPTSGDTFTLTDGTTTRTYGAGTGGDVQYTIGATVADTMANLAAAIAGDGSSIWGAAFSTDLDAIDADGVVVIVEDANSGTVFRMYGTWSTQADIQHVDFDGELDYTKKALTTLDTSDPTASNPNSGFRRVQASLTDGEIHYVLETDVIYSWDDSGNTWQTLSGSASIPDATSGSGGAIKGKVTFDSDKGLSVTAGVAEVVLGSSAGLKFVAGAVSIEPNDFAGTGLEDDGSDNLRLAAQGNGIAGGAGSTLSVDPDSETGGNIQPVNVTVNGVGLDISAIAGAGLVADGSANLDINLEATNPSLQIVADELGVKMSDGLTKDANGLAIALDATGSGLEFTGTAGDGTLGINVDGTTITINGSNELVAVGSDEATRLENTWTTATDTVAVADPVYVNGNDTVGKADAGVDAKSRVIGIIRSGSGAAPQSVEVVNSGPAAGVLSGATANTPYYLQDGGGIGTSLPGATKRIIMIGYALNATDLFVRITDYGKKAA